MPTSELLDIKAAAIRLKMLPYVILKCVKYQARGNGGMKLQCRDVSGDPYFLPADLDEFDDDLRKPWSDKAGSRPPIPSYFQEGLRQEASLRCALCDSVFATDYSHIVPWSECLHHHPENIICLCKKCHDGYDLEERISQREIQAAKARLQTRLVAMLRAERSKMERVLNSLSQLCDSVDRLLNENSVAFFNYGPQSPLAERATDPYAADIWKQARVDTILPNNAE